MIESVKTKKETIFILHSFASSPLKKNKNASRRRLHARVGCPRRPHAWDWCTKNGVERGRRGGFLSRAGAKKREPLIPTSIGTSFSTSSRPQPKKKKKTQHTFNKISAAAARLALTGRVLGISGIFGGIARGQLDAPRVAFTAGLLGAGALALPSALSSPARAGTTLLLQALPVASYSLARAVAAGALVGVGSSLGGGCTSGHGICGNARLSARSAAFTSAMMATGAAAAAASGARAAVGLPASSASAASSASFSVAPYAAPAAGAVASELGLLAVAVGAFALLALAGKRLAEKEGEEKKRRLVELAAEFSTGLFFALGLAVSGMLRPAKVVAFLTPFGGVGGWDPSLAVVMAAALAVAAPVTQRALAGAKKKREKPACSAAFSLPTKTRVDGRLLAGAAVFGVGWGIGGICPGPGLLAAAAGAGGTYLAWCGAFLAAHALTSAVS